jgi:hypothetical protein
MIKVDELRRLRLALGAFIRSFRHSEHTPDGEKIYHSAPKGGDHSAIFSSSIVYFVWTQATARPINLGRAVERLLKAEVATSAAWPSEKRVRVSPSIAQLDRGIAYLKFYRDVIRKELGWRARLRLIVGSPFKAMRVIMDIAKHFRPGFRGNVGDGSEYDLSSFDDSLTELVGNLVDQQKVSLVERDIDSRLFGGDAQEGDHYVRLVLAPLGIKLNVANEERDVTIEPRLLLHRDGAMQLTIGVHLPDDSNTEDIVSISYPSNNYILSTSLPEAYARAYGGTFEGEWEGDGGLGFRHRKIDHSTDPAAPYDMLDIVIGSISRLIRSREYGEWNCYPLIIASQGACCQDWELNHGEDLRHLSIRARPRPGDHIELNMGKDLSIRDKESHWANLASGLIFYREHWQPQISDLNHVMMHEHAMMTYTRLKRLERRIAHLPSRYKEVTGLYRIALQLSVETRGASIRWGTGRDALEHLLVALGAPQIRAAIDQGLAMLGERAALKVGEKQARLANRLALVGLLVAAIAAVPVMPDIIEFVRKQQALDPSVGFWATVGDLFSSPLRFASLIVAGCLIYLAYFMVRLFARVLVYLARNRKRGHLASAVDVELIVDDGTNEGEAPSH